MHHHPSTAPSHPSPNKPSSLHHSTSTTSSGSNPLLSSNHPNSNSLSNIPITGNQYPNYPEGTTSHERVLSSNIIHTSNVYEPVPEETIKFIEIPVIKEDIRYVPRTEIVEIEKLVPRYDVQRVERVVEVPQIEVVETEVEVEQIQEIVRKVPVKKIVEVPKEVIKYNRNIIIKKVEQRMEVPGDIVPVPKYYPVEKKVIVPRYINKEEPVLVAQIIEPVIYESKEEHVIVPLKEYEPYLVIVDLFIPKPISREIVPTNRTDKHVAIDVPPSQYNSLVRLTNPQAVDATMEGLFVKHADGGIPMLNSSNPIRQHGSKIIQPLTDEWRASRSSGQVHVDLTNKAAHKYILPTSEERVDQK